MNPFTLVIAGAFGLGGPEVLLILVVLLLLFGGSKLPELAKGLGKSIKEFKHATREDDPSPRSAERSPAPAQPATLEARQTEPASSHR